MSKPSGIMILLTALAVFLSGCVASTGNPRSRGPGNAPYAILLQCDEAAAEVGNPVRIGTANGQAMVGRLLAVNCESKDGVLVVDIYQRSGAESTAVLYFDSVEYLEVLDQVPEANVAGIVVVAVFASMLAFAAMLSNIQIGPSGR